MCGSGSERDDRLLTELWERYSYSLRHHSGPFNRLTLAGLCRLWRMFISPVAHLWGWALDGTRPDRFDIIGGTLCLVGMAVSSCMRPGHEGKIENPPSSRMPLGCEKLICKQFTNRDRELPSASKLLIVPLASLLSFGTRAQDPNFICPLDLVPRYRVYHSTRGLRHGLGDGRSNNFPRWRA